MRILSFIKKAGYCLPALVLLMPFSSAAQSVDSVYEYSTSQVVVTGKGYEEKLANSTSAISLLNKDNLEPLPVNGFSDALKIMPGFFVFNKDGLSKDPVIGVRGFYGAGEAEYIQVLLDGILLNNSETGLVDWNLIDHSSIEKVEVLRGGASALYGETAMGGVINIFTSSHGNRLHSINASAGSYNTLNLSAKTTGNIYKNDYGLTADYRSTDGFREHSSWRQFSASGRYDYKISTLSRVKLSANYYNNKSDDPGPLTEYEANQNRRAYSSFYKSDGKDEQRILLSGKFSSNYNNGELNTYINYTGYSYNRIRTFVNSVPIIDPEKFIPIGVYKDGLYGDTNEREFADNRIAGGARLLHELVPYYLKLYSGVELNYASYSTKYFNMFNGLEDDYKVTTIVRNDKTNDAVGTRTNFASYLSAEFTPSDYIRIDAGIRYDYISDNYNSPLPDSVIDITNSVFSPKLGLNFNYSSKPGYAGNVYINYNRSFKSPTIDQLTDISQLNFGVFIPVGGNQYFFNPVIADAFANSLLKPQISISYETGFYQQLKISDDVLSEFNVALYTIDVKHEIDFDISTLRYQNIVNSNHSGIESSAKFYFAGKWSLFANYTYNDVTFQSGSIKDNRLKGIPASVASTGITKKDLFGFDLSIVYSLTSSIYLDDENTTTLPDFNTLDAAISYTLNRFKISLIGKNLLNNKFSSTGYLLNGIKYLYPSTETTLFAGIEYVF